MIFPQIVSTNDLTRYIPIERSMQMENRYDPFNKQEDASDYYKNTEIQKETKYDDSVPFRSNLTEVDTYHQKIWSDPVAYADGYSEYYINFQTASFVRQVLKNLRIWANDGTDDAIPQLARIKTLLKDYERYLIVQKETRLLLGGLELIFENNNWDSLSSDKIKRLGNIFSRFENNIEMRDIKIFIHELHAQKISVMAKYESTQEEKSV